MPFEQLVLLSDADKADTERYGDWLAQYHRGGVTVHFCPLASPTDFAAIYRAAVEVLRGVAASTGEMAFHLSPGTPAMAAVWIILSRTQFPAQLIESSPRAGVRVVDFPFELAAEFLPDLLRGADQRLSELSAGDPPANPAFEAIIHRSGVMSRLLRRAQRVAHRKVPVLIEGESGTGKELLARAIHNAGPRREAAFVAVNCGAIPTELVESELFGHEKGAFTGAIRARAGYFENADGGTLFLDEIGDLPLAMQVKLLRVLQEGEVRRLGGEALIRVDVRVIAATHRDLLAEVRAGHFREDLFYRLAVAILKVPGLRQRDGDLGLLIDSLLVQVNRESEVEPGFQHKKISPGARNLLLQYPWPGNIRELLNTLRRAVIWSDGETISAEDVQESLLSRVASGTDGVLDQPLGDGFKLPLVLEKVASHYLQRALAEAAGNKTQAAELLGLSSYQTLTNWLKKYGVME